MSLFPITGGATVTVPDATIAFTASAQSSADATAYTFSSQALGTAADNRTIVVFAGYHASGGAGTDVSSITVGGTGLSEVLDTDDGGGAFHSTCYEGDITTGTSADIVVTLSAGGTRLGIGVWALYGVGASDDNSTVLGSTEATDINISAGGVAIGYCINHNNNASASWTNMTERWDDVIDYTSHTGADTSSATAVNPTVTCDWATRDSGPFNLVAWPKG
jgi:hypothetical protein